ncbi:ABC transporter ATP-binding protein [soil metagenome]
MSVSDALAGVPPSVQTQSLRKIYRSNVAVDDLSISVAQGEVFGFLGPNGAGKTTSVKMLTGLVKPSGGSGTLLGRSIGDKSSRKQVGFLPELFRFHDWLNAVELLDMHGKLYGMASAERARRIPEVLELVGLIDRREDRLRTYSKGMQQRAGLAQALLHDPLLVFLDEPTSALDPIGRRQVRDIILALKSQGKTVFLNSHLLSEVEMVCDRVAVMNHGKVVAVGPVGELLRGQLVVEFRVGNWNKAIEEEVSAFGTVESVTTGDSGASLILTSLDGENCVPPIVNCLVQHCVAVYGVTTERKTLEDLFIDLVDVGDRARYGR